MISAMPSQKNGAVVRQVIGSDRFEGERAYRQLGEVYQALRLYVNGFQPSMKLQAKQYDGKKVRRIYDAAKTPLQRLLLSRVLPASKENELQRVAQVLDPLRLFHHLQDLQQALLGFTTSVSSGVEGISSVMILPFCIERCIGKPGHASSETEEGARQKHLLHPFAPDPVPSCQREQDANGRTHSLRREICSAQVAPSQQPGEECLLLSQPIVGEKEALCPAITTNDGTAQDRSMLSHEPLQLSHISVNHQPSRRASSDRTLAQAIQDFLEGGIPGLFRRQESWRLSHLLFRGNWAQVIERGMPANPVVKALDGLKDGLSGLFTGLKVLTLNALAFPWTEETRPGRMIGAVARAAQTHHHRKVRQSRQGARSGRRTALVRVQPHLRWGRATHKSHFQREPTQPLISGGAHGPADHQAGKAIQDDGHRQPAFCRPDGGRLTPPCRVGVCCGKVPGQHIGSRNNALAPFGPHRLLPPALSCQIHLAHETGCPLTRATDPLLA
jgi:hypothetical protein